MCHLRRGSNLWKASKKLWLLAYGQVDAQMRVFSGWASQLAISEHIAFGPVPISNTASLLALNQVCQSVPEKMLLSPLIPGFLVGRIRLEWSVVGKLDNIVEWNSSPMSSFVAWYQKGPELYLPDTLMTTTALDTICYGVLAFEITPSTCGQESIEISFFFSILGGRSSISASFCSIILSSLLILWVFASLFLSSALDTILETSLIIQQKFAAFVHPV